MGFTFGVVPGARPGACRVGGTGPRPPRQGASLVPARKHRAHRHAYELWAQVSQTAPAKGYRETAGASAGPSASGLPRCGSALAEPWQRPGRASRLQGGVEGPAHPVSSAGCHRRGTGVWSPGGAKGMRKSANLRPDGGGRRGLELLGASSHCRRGGARGGTCVQCFCGGSWAWPSVSACSATISLPSCWLPFAARAQRSRSKEAGPSGLSQRGGGGAGVRWWRGARHLELRRRAVTFRNEFSSFVCIELVQHRPPAKPNGRPERVDRCARL